MSGTEQDVTSAGTPGSATVTISGSEGSHIATVCGAPYRIINGIETPTCRQETVFDTGTISITVSAFTATVSYGATSTDASIASALASGLSASGSPVTACASGSTITITALADGVASNYPLSMGMQGGADPTVSNGVVYSYSVPSGGHDAVGNVTSYTDQVMGKWSFGYDTLNRLTSTSAGANVPTGYAKSYGCWTYDGFGNRLKEAYSNQTSTPCATGANDNLQLTVTNQSTGNNNQVAGYTYDDAGDVMNDNRNQYMYDADGRICAVAYNNGSGWSYDEYLYDADGYRVGKVAEPSLSCAAPASSPSHEYLLGQGGQQVTELTLQGSTMTPLHTNVFAGGGLMATYDFPDNGVHFALTDPLGTRRVQVSGAGVAEIGVASLPYGNDLGNSDVPQSINYAGGTDATEHHFTGKERDAESGNDYFEARYYGGSIGRFLSPDWSAKAEPVPYAKVGDPQSLNLYSYVANNPLGSVDPVGHATDALVGDMGPGYTAFAEIVENMVGVEGAEEMGIADGNTLAAANSNLLDSQENGTVQQQDQQQNQQHPAPTPTSAAQRAAPPAVAGTLTISTNTATGSGPSSLLGNHAWLTFVTADGTVYTYGTYGSGNGAQGVQGVNENSELGYPATASRSASISADQARILGVFINDMIKEGPAAWSNAFPCSGFAAVGWDLTTGENLDPTRHGILDSPDNLEGAINAANNQH